MRNIMGLVMSVIVASNLTFAVKKFPTEGDPVPSGISTDPTYGCTEKNPIRVGQKNGGPKDERMYLNTLRGPHGEIVEFKRQGSCCFFKTPNAWVGGKAELDRYELSYVELEKPLILYFDMYDYEQPLIPVGFTKTP